MSAARYVQLTLQFVPCAVNVPSNALVSCDASYRCQQQFEEAERAVADSGAWLWASNTCGGDTTRPASG